jgi:hypothetical protein
MTCGSSVTRVRSPLAIRFSCSCGASFTVPDDLAGRAGLCPSCEAPLVAPGSLPEAPVASTARDQPADPFKVVRVDCACGRLVSAPLQHLQEGKARCPSCDRVLVLEESKEE